MRNHRLHRLPALYFVGTRRFSSSTQCCTNIICAGSGSGEGSVSRTVMNRRPSGETS
jgi:hypothetical protein